MGLTEKPKNKQALNSIIAFLEINQSPRSKLFFYGVYLSF
jgi:hypothetical protein